MNMRSFIENNVNDSLSKKLVGLKVKSNVRNIKVSDTGRYAITDASFKFIDPEDHYNLIDGGSTTSPSYEIVIKISGSKGVIYSHCYNDIDDLNHLIETL